MRTIAIAIAMLCWGTSGISSAAAPRQGAITLVGEGALIRYRSMLLALDGAPARQAVDLHLTSASSTQAPQVQARSLPLWQALTWRKGRLLVRITTLPGPGDSPALLLDFGDNAYRIVIASAGVSEDAYPLLAQRYPGADLVLLPEGGRRVIVRAGQRQTSPYRFSRIKR